MNKKIKAIIFDMDGVLIEAKDWHYEAFNKALELFGLTITRHEHETTYDGLPTKDKLKMLTREKGLSVKLHSFLNEMKQQYTMEMVHTLCKPQFHHEFALSKLSSENFKLAVASNSIRNTVSVMMDQAHLKQYLEFYISNEDVSKGKPDPEMYNLAIARLGFSAEECVIVEDNEHGLMAARASGANVLKVDSVYDVNYENIKSFIEKVEAE
ncbi:HAD family phosphatase [Vibrio parahaemolyticus]|nr:HAD family phosphatase [Vibrio parahaemolyticus]MDF4334958.1 HAD family phosphatase [Vibrio parahaemolyticus]TBT27458.1 HAD family phosphatase [Vibrio parahaemolyticus]HAU8253657.1 HAD-IA family hydrolase [Vibrio vulnificus]